MYSSVIPPTVPTPASNHHIRQPSPLFLAASVITTVAVAAGADVAVFAPLKTLSRFFIVMAMAAIGLNTDLVKLVKSGAKPILMGLICWICIAAASLAMQHTLGLW